MAPSTCLAGPPAGVRAARLRAQAAPRALLPLSTSAQLRLGGHRPAAATPGPLLAPRRGLPPLRRRSLAVAAAQRPAVELLLDAIPGSEEVLSARLMPSVRERTERAIKARGGRVTIG